MNFQKKLLLVLLFFYLGIFFIICLNENEDNLRVESQKVLPEYSMIQRHYSQIVNSSEDSAGCKVRNYPFTEEEAKRIFAFNDYGPCPKYDDVITTYSNRVYKVKCKIPKNALYSADFNRNPAYGGGQKLNVFWRKVRDPHITSEFSFVKCSKRSVHAMVFNKFKADVAAKANKIRSKFVSKDKNMNVLLLVFDSVSRYTYETYLPKTMKFLNDLEKSPEFGSHFSYHEFEKSATPHHYTVYNMGQILFGKKAEDLISEMKLDRNGNPIIPRVQKDNQKFAIWTHYQKLGYTTMFLHDSVWDYIPMLTGRVIDTDHCFVDFWKYVWGVYNWHDFSDSQRCAGSKNSHDLSFDYTYQYFFNYKENNKFAYVHLDAAHESTGNIVTVDDDLARFLKDFLTLIRERDENLALFMISDHGNKHMGRIRWDIRSFYEVHVPMTHLILSKRIENDWNARESLTANKKRLLSRMDLNLSLKQIAYFPYNITIDLQQLKDYEYDNIISLFSEKASLDRTCSSIGVAKEHCLCSWFQDVNQNDEREIFIRDSFIGLLRNYFEDNANQVLECDPMQDFVLTIFKSFQMKEEETAMDTLYFFEFELGSIKITAIGNFNFKTEKWKFKKVADKKMLPYLDFEYQGRAAFLQVNEVKVVQKCFENMCFCKSDPKLANFRG